MTDETTPPVNPPAGWYPDPYDPASVRWWDGAGWGPTAPGIANAPLSPGTNASPQDTRGRKPVQALRDRLRAFWRGLGTPARIALVALVLLVGIAGIMEIVPTSGANESSLILPATDDEILNFVESAACSSRLTPENDQSDAARFVNGRGIPYTCRTDDGGWVNLVLFRSNADFADVGVGLRVVMCIAEGDALSGLRVALQTNDSTAAVALEGIGAVSMDCVE